jgi:hypothetical protein
LVAGFALAFVIAACGDDESVLMTTTTTTTVVATTTTSAAPSTTSAPTTTVPPTTTTTVPPTTTTTEPPPTFGFFMDGLGVAQFGDPPAAVIAALTDLFGDPLRDTGWVEEPICPGPMTRIVGFGDDFGDFDIYFTTGDLFAPSGTEHFHGYDYQGATTVPVSPPALTVGTKISELEALYPSVVFADNPFFAGEFDFIVDGPGNQGLNGRVSGTDPGDVVLTVEGGVGCGE